VAQLFSLGIIRVMKQFIVILICVALLVILGLLLRSHFHSSSGDTAYTTTVQLSGTHPSPVDPQNQRSVPVSLPSRYDARINALQISGFALFRQPRTQHERLHFTHPETQTERPGLFKYAGQHHPDFEGGAGEIHGVAFVVLNQFAKGDGARTFPIDFYLPFEFFGHQLPRLVHVVGAQVFPSCASGRFENRVNRTGAPHSKQPMSHPLKTPGFLLFWAPG